MNVSELEGIALDWAVALCEVGPIDIKDIDDPHFYSTDWAEGGPIIERERIDIYGYGGDAWGAEDNLRARQYGDTPLVAAMRCYVASKLGEEIDVPEALLNQKGERE